MSARGIIRAAQITRYVLALTFGVLIVQAVVGRDTGLVPWIITVAAISVAVITFESAVEVLNERDDR